VAASVKLEPLNLSESVYFVYSQLNMSLM